jgi:hypothetical protein
MSRLAAGPDKSRSYTRAKNEKAEIIIFNSTSMAWMDPSQPQCGFSLIRAPMKSAN